LPAVQLLREGQTVVLLCWVRFKNQIGAHIKYIAIMNLNSFIFIPVFPLEVCGDSSPRRTQNTSRFSAISDSSAGSTPRQLFILNIARASGD